MDCERVRLDLMAAFDGERPSGTEPGADARQHLASCAACSRWLQDLESMTRRFDDVSYLGTNEDVWPAVQRRLQLSDMALPATRLYVIGALVLGWRALQLLIDLPLPLLQSVIPLAAVVAALWQRARDPLAIRTFVPELQKRGA
jgi:predicted anti-sigma-YlaC factor YlaD